MIRRPPRSTQSRSSAASDVYKRQPQLPQVAFAPGADRRLLAARQSRQEQPSQNGNDGNHHQQLDQRERPLAGIRPPLTTAYELVVDTPVWKIQLFRYDHSG